MVQVIHATKAGPTCLLHGTLVKNVLVKTWMLKVGYHPSTVTQLVRMHTNAMYDM